MSAGPVLVLPHTVHVGSPPLFATTSSPTVQSTCAQTYASVMASVLAPTVALGLVPTLPGMTPRHPRTTPAPRSAGQAPRPSAAKPAEHVAAGTARAPSSSSSPAAANQAPSRVQGCAEVLYLHGFGTTQPERSVIAHMLSRAVDGSGARFHCPCYHPGGDVRATRIGEFLAQLRSLALSLPSGRFSVIVGFSFGGLVAALFQEQCPELVGSVVLLAPSIDSYERNFRDVPKALWYMPPEYVEELARLPARPTIKVPTTLLHGMSDFDGGEDMPARAKEWASQANFAQSCFPPAVNHSMEPWISSESPGLLGTPSLKETLTWALHVG